MYESSVRKSVKYDRTSEQDLKNIVHFMYVRVLSAYTSLHQKKALGSSQRVSHDTSAGNRVASALQCGAIPSPPNQISSNTFKICLVKRWEWQALS